MRGPKMAHRKIIVSNSPPPLHTHTHTLRHFERIIAMHALHMIVWGRFFFFFFCRYYVLTIIEISSALALTCWVLRFHYYNTSIGRIPNWVRVWLLPIQQIQYILLLAHQEYVVLLSSMHWPKLGQGMTSPYSVDTVYSFACSSGICGSP